MGELDYIRQHYGVPAKRGARIRFTDGGFSREGTIVSASGPYLRVQFDGMRYKSTLHPTWNVEYIADSKTGARSTEESK
jgi:hypothetical protein